MVSDEDFLTNLQNAHPADQKKDFPEHVSGPFHEFPRDMGIKANYRPHEMNLSHYNKKFQEESKFWCSFYYLGWKIKVCTLTPKSFSTYLLWNISKPGTIENVWDVYKLQ